jgi:hypothetical protein
MAHGLSKSRLQAFRQCPKRLWLAVHRSDLQEISPETEQRLQIGFQVGDIARTLHPDGISIDTPAPREALALTRRALAAQPGRPLLEAAFQRDGVLVRADLLLPETGGYRLREVKASTSVKDEHRADCAIQAWVIGATLSLTGVELAHVDTAFVYPGGGDYRGLLSPNPVDEDIARLLPAVPQWIAAARATLDGAEPAIAIGPQCHSPYDCPFLETAPGRLAHQAFLAEGQDDPRRAFAETLLAAVGDAGPVFVYNRGFEAGRLRELAQMYPDLAAMLAALIARVVDLKPLTERYYCHPALKGSWSLKAVLPTIAPDLDYEELAIGDGGAASSAWRELYHPAISADRSAQLRAALADYCRRDTLALVRLAAFLAESPTSD